MSNSTLTPKEKPQGVQQTRRKNDLSHRLELELAREPGQFVNAHAVGQDNFRVNWLVFDGPSQKIVKSQFIRATAGEGNALVVEDKTIRSHL